MAPTLTLPKKLWGQGVIVVAEEPIPVVSRITSQVCPHPVLEEANLQLVAPSTAEFVVEVFSILGKRILRTRVNLWAGEETHIKLDIDELRTGLYLYRITAQSGIHGASGSFLSVR